MSSAPVQSLPDFRAAHPVSSTPTVAVSATSDSSLGGAHRVRLNSAYVTSLENAGLVPLVVPPLRNDVAARAIVSRVDGILLTGGEDVEPTLYGQERNENSGQANEPRDRTEIALIRAARELRKPILAICRGPQVLNVALGGTLIQDIPSQVPGALEHNSPGNRAGRVHEVIIDKDSMIAAAIGATHIMVNSLHHQSVLDVAPGMKVTARSTDGIVEGIESTDEGWWAMGVQWHPEEMNDSPESWDRGLFKAFADKLTGE